MPRPCDAFVGLGANAGDRRRTLRSAVAALRRLAGVRVTGVSPLYATAHVGPGRAPDYLNGAVRLRTRLEPGRLVRALLAIERRHGRTRPRPLAPRTLDLDLLLLGDAVSADPRATVPHPRLHRRAFALRPVLDLAPAARHPVLDRPLAALLADLPRGQRIRRVARA